MQDNLLSEAGNHVELNSIGEKVVNNHLNSQHEQNLETKMFTFYLPDLDKCSMQDNSFPDATNNAKLNMVKENVMT